VERVTTVPDREADIARVVNEYRAEYDAVVVTGGVGPTHDDVTMAGVAAALGRELVANDAALEWLETESDYAADELDDGTTALPAGARPLHNTVGVAPGCVVDGVYVLPGVPGEMRAMFETVTDEFGGDRDAVAVVETSEPESELLGRLRAVREEFDVTVGSYPGETVRVKFAGETAAVESATAWFRERVDTV
jgi:competence/damage-inducible protein cinA